jgi:hypothetical protein
MMVNKWAVFCSLAAIALGATLPAIPARGPITADHRAADNFRQIPRNFVIAAKSGFRVYYGHTSHGSQIITGMEMLRTQLYDFNKGPGTLSVEEVSGDLGQKGDLTWEATTRKRLNQPGNEINLVMWSWCGGVSDNTPAGIDKYLQAMNRLEIDYPKITFVYMTGHTDGSGITGNLNVRNHQIRDFCRTHNKILFDFADIESWDPAGNYYPDTSDDCSWCATWCATHSCPGCTDCAHSHCFTCYLKGKAFWWMMARLAGWQPGDTTAPRTLLLQD